jgi:hypothetical protein
MTVKADMFRQIHDAAIELGAQCDSSCVFFNSPQKSYTRERARALMFLHELGHSIPTG